MAYPFIDYTMKAIQIDKDQIVEQRPTRCH